MKNQIKHKLGRYPWMFFPVYRALGPARIVDECLLSSDKELVIEGFPRSANTFAVVAFRQAQGRHVPMAHHLHVEAQLLRGVQLGLPAIALIRNPDEAIRSLLIRHPNTDPIRAYKRWLEFYNAVKNLAGHVVIAPFEVVTSDYGRIIKKVNDCFETEYSEFKCSRTNTNAVFREIDQINLAISGGNESHVARPSEMRSRARVDIPDCDYRNRALALYEYLMMLAL